MSPEVVCLERRGRLSDRDRRREHAFAFEVPARAHELRLAFRYAPDRVGPHQNMLTLSLFDPRGFRGAGHRLQSDQVVVVGAHEATSGFLPGPLHAGPWEVGIDAHEILNDGRESGWCEFELVITARVEAPGPAAPDPRDSPPAPQSLGRGPAWYRGDLHSHSVHSDGSGGVAEMAAAARRRGLDFLASTDHNTTSAWLSPAEWPTDLLRIRGIECTTWFGHANALGTSRWIDWRTAHSGTGLRSLVAQAHGQDALLVANHPFAAGNPICTGCSWDFKATAFEGVDALEIWNGPWWERGAGNADALALWTDLLDDGRRICCVGGSDSHGIDGFDRAGLGFTSVFVPELSESAVLDALRLGHAYVSSGPTLTFEARSAAATPVRLPGDTIPTTGPIDLRVRIAELEVPATLWQVVGGDARALARIEPPGGEVASIGEGGRWWRLELREGREYDADPLVITNPVYGPGRY